MPSGITLPKPFDGSEHKSFLWEGNDCAALLVHGFPGTPAEMRPLGTVLREAGWTVQGLMLPGLGADIETLETRSFRDWVNSVTQAVRELKREHPLVIVVGYSMGGALALCAAPEERLHGLFLLAPFWSIGDRWQSLFWPVIRLLFRRVKPLKRADFSAPEVRRALGRMFEGIDLDNPRIQHALRHMTVSLRPIEQLRQLGHSAFDRASTIETPTVVIQGSRDKTVLPHRTKRLINRLASKVQYHEVNAGHDLSDPESGAWIQVKGWLQLFAETMRQQAGKKCASGHRIV